MPNVTVSKGNDQFRFVWVPSRNIIDGVFGDRGWSVFCMVQETLAAFVPELYSKYPIIIVIGTELELGLRERVFGYIRIVLSTLDVINSPYGTPSLIRTIRYRGAKNSWKWFLFPRYDDRYEKVRRPLRCYYYLFLSWSAGFRPWQLPWPIWILIRHSKNI